MKSPLARLMEPLEELEYYADHLAITEDGMYERLQLRLEVDESRPELEYSVEIYYINDVMEALGAEMEGEDAILTQFMLVLPFRFPIEAFIEAMRLCNIVNRLLPMGAFGLSEQDDAVYLRYVLATETRAIPGDVLIEVVQAFEHACQEYGPHFEKIAQRESTADAFIAAFEASGHPLPSVGNPDLLRAN
jgi:hypothetical protein